ncbi:MAG: class I SAM-dependent methyltransferase [Elusimicrobia bacterium]|nr:class I SAM-dependent methyltransferase [Elusimicrobiota bacterium]
MNGFYDEAAVYDLLHARDTEAELDAVLALHARFGNGGRRVLEPACGTGRYLAALAARGFAAAGYDLNPRALAFARRRLEGLGVRLTKAGMTSFIEAGAYDLAFSTLSSFRHLLTQQDALRHLRLTARSLAPGGVYVIGLDLADYASAQDDEETWEAADKGMSVRHVALSLAPDARRRRERIINFVTVAEGGRERLVESSYDLRSYDRGQWESLIAASALRILGSERALGGESFVLGAR